MKEEEKKKQVELTDEELNDVAGGTWGIKSDLDQL